MVMIKDVLVKCGKSKTELIEGKVWVMHLKSRPVDNKANSELIKFFSKKFKCKVEIVSGLRGKKKRVKFI